MANILVHFGNLAKVDQSSRVAACNALIEDIKASDDAGNVDYSLRRLVRGLASGHAGARPGFASALAMLVEALPARISVRQVLLLLDDVLGRNGGLDAPYHGSADGVNGDAAANEDISTVATTFQFLAPLKPSEARDTCYGRVFCIASIVRSGRKLTRNEALRMANELVACAQFKPYMEPIALGILADLMRSASFPLDLLKAEPFTLFFKFLPAPTKVSKSKEDDEDDEELNRPMYTTGSHIGLALIAYELLGGKPDKSVFAGWRKGNPLHEKNLETIAKVMRISNEYIQAPQVHFAWTTLFHAVLTRAPELLERVWATLVDQQLFESSHERRLLGLMLFERALANPDWPSDRLNVIFSPHLLRCLVNNLAAPTNNLHPAAAHATKAIVLAVRARRSDVLCIHAVTHLLGPHGAARFDNRTRTRTVESIVAELSAQGVTDYVEFLIDATRRDPSATATPTVSVSRHWAADQLVALVRNPHLPRSDVWLERAATHLLALALDEAKKHVEEEATGGDAKAQENDADDDDDEDKKKRQWTHEKCLQRFRSVLAELCTIQSKKKEVTDEEEKEEATSEAEETRVIPGQRDDGQLWVTFLDEWIDARKSSSSSGKKGAKKAKKTAPESVRERLQAATRALASQSQGSTARGYALLLSYASLECALALSTATDADASGEELLTCYEVEFEQRSMSVEKEEGEGEDAKQSRPDNFAVLVDILLSWLAQASVCQRHIVEQAFVLLAPKMTRAAMELLVDVVTALPEEHSGKDDDVEEEEEEEGDDDEMEKMSGGESSSDDEEEEEEEEEEEDDDGDEKADVDEDLRARIRLALGPAVHEMKDNDDSDNESDVSSMDDDAMERLDGLLVAAFKAQSRALGGSGAGSTSERKQERKNAQRRSADFKMRVLQLLALFVRRVDRPAPAAAAVAAVTPSKKKTPKKAKKATASAEVETAAETVTGPELCLDLIVPLLHALRVNAANESAKMLYDRVAGILRNRVCHLRHVPVVHSAAGLERLNASLDEVFRETTRILNMQHSSLVASCVIVLVRTLQASGRLDEERLSQLYKTAYDHFLARRGTRLQADFFGELIRRQSALAWHVLVPHMLAGMTAGEGGGRGFLVSQTFRLLKALVKGGTVKDGVKVDAKTVDAMHEALAMTLQRETQRKEGETETETEKEKDAEKEKSKGKGKGKKKGAQQMKSAHLIDVLQFVRAWAQSMRKGGIEAGASWSRVVEAVDGTVEGHEGGTKVGRVARQVKGEVVAAVGGGKRKAASGVDGEGAGGKRSKTEKETPKKTKGKRALVETETEKTTKAKKAKK